ncbi:phytanoyl-CoA dioxygenase family protein [Mesorhizobium sp. LHD-90]|uniref:phytanoyl-CoA dioxygenase family protein n=1 Tax=Mesorhizobium sp. LHD-90 TaxID=3071414 RepID=UPI0027DEABDD|nr:phytanoyl-CoA dioxygenase family protein [Mesorhizobium sp. LHD-90]MDQ6433019.1 phytanoyl-CoA dioxygenase family protein [Mesorhizobium sp. LHD-90]
MNVAPRKILPASDRDLIEAHDESLRLEKRATAELRDRLDSYLPPNYRSRKMVDHWDRFIDNRGYMTEDEYMNFRYACEETRLQSNIVFSSVLADNLPSAKIKMEESMFADALKKGSENTVRLNGEDDSVQLSDPWASVIDGGYKYLRKYGYWKVPSLAPADLVKNLRSKIERQFSSIQEEVDKTMAGKDGAQLAHWIKTSQAFVFEDLHKLASDPLLYSVAQKYLGVPPIFTTPVSVLSGPVRPKQQTEMFGTGQLYHYDMHRLKFVKMFIYLTDVGPGSGPHTLIPGTHIKRPDSLLEDRRYSEEEMIASGVKGDEVSITGPAGTVFFVDTSCYHKGASPLTDYRIMAQVQFSNSLFGKPVKPVEHKIQHAHSTDQMSGTLEKSCNLVRKYARKRGARFMQNYI